MTDDVAIGLVTGLRDEMTAHLREIREMGITRIQLVYPPDRLGDNAADIIASVQCAVSETEVAITSVVCTFPGERYDDIAAVQQTVGFVPESTRAERLAATRAFAEVAKKLGVGRLCCHIGYIPEDAADPVHAELVAALRSLCADLAAGDLVFALETGQETAKG